MKFYVLFEIDTKKKKIDINGFEIEKPETNANQLALEMFLSPEETRLTFLYWLAEHDIVGVEAEDTYNGMIVTLVKLSQNNFELS